MFENSILEIEKLANNIGKEISYEIYIDGRLNKYTDILTFINGFDGFGVENKYIPFIASNKAVKRVLLKENGTILYENSNIKSGYGKNNENVELEICNKFGEDAALSYRKKQEETKTIDELLKKEEIANLEFAKYKYLTIEEGLSYVTEDMKEKWKYFADKYIKDAYSYNIAKKSVICMKALSNGLDINKLKEILNQDDNSIMENVIIAATISTFNKNGIDFNSYYKKKNNIQF